MCGCGKLSVRKTKNNKSKKLTLAKLQNKKTQTTSVKRILLSKKDNELRFNPTPGLIGQTTAQVRGGGGVGVRRLRKNKRIGKRKNNKGKKIMRKH